MRRIVARLGALLVAAAMTLPAGAQAQAPLVETSPNVEFIDNVPLEATATGAQLLGGYLYVSSSRGLHIYDVRDPAAAGLVGEYTVYRNPYYVQEDPATNGRILLLTVQSVDYTQLDLLILDVSNKESPHVIGRLENPPTDLTFACVLDCKWAYGSHGSIIDLRDPTSPVVVQTRHPGEDGAGHSVSEIAPGRILVDASGGPLLLDARRSPGKPKVVADSGLAPFFGTFHSVDWPAQMKSGYVLAGMGSVNSCDLTTFDVRDWLSENRIHQADTFSLGPTEPGGGNGPPATFDCPHWFDVAPDFGRAGGFVVAPWHQRGVRFLRVGRDGSITPDGYFQPLLGDSWTTLWGADDHIYSIDYVRGIDILRIHR